MKEVYSPGCALLIYKPHLAYKIQAYLNHNQVLGRGLAKESVWEFIQEHQICCKHQPGLVNGTEVINTCPGCDRRFRELYEGITTRSLWELLAKDDSFPFPNYEGLEMTIHDACPTRMEDRVHTAIRKLLKKMNINLVEPEHTRKNSICCGDSFYGMIPVKQVKEQMKKRAGSLPCEDVIVYCVSCIKSMYNGGKRPHYLADLLFQEETEIGTFEPEDWHDEIDRFIGAH